MDNDIYFTCPDCGEKHKLNIFKDNGVLNIILSKDGKETGTLKIDIPKIHINK